MRARYYGKAIPSLLASSQVFTPLAWTSGSLSLQTLALGGRPSTAGPCLNNLEMAYRRTAAT